jgi:hypothetical protein
MMNNAEMYATQAVKNCTRMSITGFCKKGEQCDENVTIDMNYGVIASTTLEEHSYAFAIQIVQA